MKYSNLEKLTRRVLSKRPLWLFLDYDGTLADFTPSLETVDLNPQVVDLLNRLASKDDVRLTVLSGRRLHDVLSLIPVPEIFLAGVYGIEIRTPSGELINRVNYDDIHPFLGIIKPKWEEIIAGRTGFFLEDKDWALALHAHFGGGDAEAEDVLAQARKVVDQSLPEEQFRILGGDKFLEVAPLLAHKGITVSYLSDTFPLPNAQFLYIGDDDKDEEAFVVIQELDGLTIKVAGQAQASQPTRADFILDSPSAVNSWLEILSAKL